MVVPGISVSQLVFFSFLDRKKYEIATDEDFTPIKQDEKKGMLREVRHKNGTNQESLVEHLLTL
jgi:hypothetical protein